MRLIDTLAIRGSSKKGISKRIAPWALLILGTIVAGCAAGSPKSTSSSTTSSGPQTYMSAFMIGDSLPGYSVSAYSIDDTVQSFSKSTYFVGKTGATGQGPLQLGAQTFYAGTTTALKRGLLSLAGTYEFSNQNSTTLSPPQTGSWAVELPNQAGGLVQIKGQVVEPLVAATSCPGKPPQTYQFLTLPTAFGDSQAYFWDPTLETVYGSVDISGTGSTIAFNNIHQYALPSFPDLTPGAPAIAVTSPQTGTCSSGYYGNTIVVPGSLTVTNPGPGSVVQPVALVGIGPTGLLVESNAAMGEPNTPPYDVPPFYQNLLGAGTGAIGLPKPSSALDTSALVGAQYLGFFYGAGSGANDWSSFVASFGFATLSPGCRQVATQTPTMIYGGDFAGNNPALPAYQANGGFGNCDFAIDLGTQDPNNNGLYPAATVYVSAFYTGNQTAANYGFPAVAIAGKLGEKFAIFLSGIDIQGYPAQPWGIYLLQSN